MATNSMAGPGPEPSEGGATSALMRLKQKQQVRYDLNTPRHALLVKAVPCQMRGGPGCVGRVACLLTVRMLTGSFL